MTAEKIRVRESLLAQIWKGQWVQKGPFPTSDKRMITIRSTGRENSDSGPDFLGAVVLLDDEIVTGDVELHVKSSDWRSHKHHCDPHFNSVILQVVLWDDSKTAAILENGRSIPTLSLHDYLNGSMDELSIRAEEQQLPSFPCKDAIIKLGSETLSNILDQYGMERLYIKSAYYEVALILEEPDQVLYEGIMGALGYTKNKLAFQKLAKSLQLHVLESIVNENHFTNRKHLLQSLFLGSAGLLPSQCKSKANITSVTNVDKIEATWQSLKIETNMNRSDWHFFRMHPRNFPDSRLLAAGHIFENYPATNLINGISDIMQKALQTGNTTAIEKSFQIPALLGQSRAREIVINVVLPFFMAMSETNNNHNLNRQVTELYRSYPKGGGNQITRYLEGLFWNNPKNKVINSAQKQQGLIHLYKAFCQEQRCRTCPVNVSSL